MRRGAAVALGLLGGWLVGCSPAPKQAPTANLQGLSPDGQTLMWEARPNETMPALPPGLRALHLRRVGATAIFALSLPASLESVDLSDNSLPALPDYFLPVGMQRLWLADNRLRALPRTMGEWRQLVYLNVDRNQLEALPSLEGLPLRWLRLNGNRLSALPVLPPTLERLYAADNRLSALPALPAGLRQATFAGNPVVEVPAGWGQGLEMLDLSRTQLQALPVDLSGWRSLKVLNLSRCPLPAAERRRIEAAFEGSETVLLF